MKEDKDKIQNNPLMFIDSVKGEIKENNEYIFDSRKMDCFGINKDSYKLVDKFKDIVSSFKAGKVTICKYKDQLVIPYKLENMNLYGIKVLENIKNQYERLNEFITIPLTEEIEIIR